MPVDTRQKISQMGFSRDKLAKVPDKVKNLTVADLNDMAKMFGGEGRVRNPRIQSLSAEDLKSIDDLFGEYRNEVLSTFSDKPDLGAGFSATGELEAEWSIGSCCCSPCCCCAATEIDPFE